ncbi:class I tRNA ligase family protein, partial [Candidatus Woesearchaeota archaeon]|nr:class I tRNA ligase family protein [Candidatus Woesearchaeota archaeon]
MEFPKNYNPQESEPKLIEFWEKERIYAFDPESKAEIYSVDTPPPTVSGKMHIGHSFSYSQQDFVVRFQRMLGKNIFYPFGTDDNGLATIILIEKMKNVKDRNMNRKEFVELCLKTLGEIRPDVIYDWKRIGLSADFTIFYSTIDEHCQKISQKSFIDLYKIGRIYRKKAPIMFCPNCLTAIAQVELKDAERESNLVYIKADVEGAKEHLVFATTRPELIYACVGISVHPDDKRYGHLIGKQVKIPIINRSVELIPDEYTDMEYGSGVVYYCTYGGVECIDWLMRHPKIKPIDVMGMDGRLNDLSGKYKGMKSGEARKQVIEDLKEEGALARLEKIKHVVNTHERCDTDIEYIATEQWYIRYLDLKDDFIKFGRKIKWYPEHMRARYENWIYGLKWDWNISRQRHFGIPIPVWYCKKCNEIIIADEKQLPVDPLVDKPLRKCKCGSEEFIGEKDVLDTWHTSSLTP